MSVNVVASTVFVLAAMAVAVALSGSQPSAAANGSSNVLAPLSACPGQTSTSAAAAAQLRAMRCLINWARAHRGEGAVRRNAELDRSAAMRAADIRRCNDFSHTPCGRPFLAVFKASHYLTGVGSVGENIAWGQGVLGSARSTLSAWLGSPEHRRILFTARWRDLGLARLKAARLDGYSNVTIWVAQFGFRSGSR
jgi:uncharacterized protein YkwD